MDQDEKLLLVSASCFSRSRNVSLAKIAWALSSILQRPENHVFNSLKEIDINLDAELTKIAGVRKLAESYSELEEELMNEDRLEERVGEIVDVEVLSVKTFGAICKVEDSTRTLLLHLSEVANEFISDLNSLISKGDKFQAMLIINPKEELGLSTKKIGGIPQGIRADSVYRELYQTKESEFRE